MVRTRFAPSPTGFLHIGGARTALFSWAFARHHQGQFILRIEDTDLARSTPEAVQAILDGMQWLGLDHDEGPFYQTQRMDRYKAVIQEMLAAGTAYPCYATPEELEAMRAEQMARNEKPRYDGRWRPEPGKELPVLPVGAKPVIRFRNPTDGVVAWDDLVKGRIEISNRELDDLIIARADGTPTYNFCVVVDDWDMGITQVIRGDDHVNNTPRQINILQALGAPVPQYAHLSMILGDDGQKLSKRHGAVSVMQYDDEGYLPEAVNNYLARLGWSHGDDEVFSREQFVAWFDLSHITPSAAQFNTQKLNWLNAHYIKQADVDRLAADVRRRLALRKAQDSGVPSVESIVALYRDRAQTLVELTDAVEQLQGHPQPTDELKTQHLTPVTLPILAAFRTALVNIDWDVASIAAALKATLAEHGAKMPALAMPVRLALAGQTQTPSVDALIELFPREEVLKRIDHLLG
ncbi:MAG: glutamyl-tRNA synthetase [Pseudomonadota bacterium]|jgi:glutamyl-tRNA synthetase